MKTCISVPSGTVCESVYSHIVPDGTEIQVFMAIFYQHAVPNGTGLLDKIPSFKIGL